MNKRELAIKDALDRIDGNIFELELIDGRLKMGVVWETQTKASWAAKETKAYFYKATGQLVAVEVSYYGKDGKVRGFCGGCASVKKRVQRIR